MAAPWQRGLASPSLEVTVPQRARSQVPVPSACPSSAFFATERRPLQTAAFPGALPACAWHAIALPCSLPSALQASLFLPLNRRLLCKSSRPVVPPRGPVSALHSAALPWPCLASLIVSSGIFPGDWQALGFAPPGLMPITCIFFCPFHAISPFLPSPPAPLCYLLQFGILTFCRVLFFLALHLWGFHSHHFSPNSHRYHYHSSFHPARFLFGASAVSMFPDMVWGQGSLAFFWRVCLPWCAIAHEQRLGLGQAQAEPVLAILG